LSLSETFESPYSTGARKRAQDALASLAALEAIVQGSLVSLAPSQQTKPPVEIPAPSPPSLTPLGPLQPALPPGPEPSTARATFTPPARRVSTATTQYRPALADPSLVEALLHYQKTKPRGVIKAKQDLSDFGEKPSFQSVDLPSIEASPKTGIDPRRPSGAFQTILRDPGSHANRPPHAPYHRRDPVTNS
jgi:hypothetical protein